MIVEEIVKETSGAEQRKVLEGISFKDLNQRKNKDCRDGGRVSQAGKMTHIRGRLRILLSPRQLHIHLIKPSKRLTSTLIWGQNKFERYFLLWLLKFFSMSNSFDSHLIMISQPSLGTHEEF